MPTEHLHRVVVDVVAVVVLISKEGDAEQFRVPLDSGPGWEDGFVSGRPRPLFFIDADVVVIVVVIVVIVDVVVVIVVESQKNLRRRSSHFWAFFLRRRSPVLSENSPSRES